MLGERDHEYFLLCGQWAFWSNNPWRIQTELNKVLAHQSYCISEKAALSQKAPFFTIEILPFSLNAHFYKLNTAILHRASFEQ